MTRHQEGTGSVQLRAGWEQGLRARYCHGMPDSSSCENQFSLAGLLRFYLPTHLQTDQSQGPHSDSLVRSEQGKRSVLGRLRFRMKYWQQKALETSASKMSQSIMQVRRSRNKTLCETPKGKEKIDLNLIRTSSKMLSIFNTFYEYKVAPMAL